MEGTQFKQFERHSAGNLPIDIYNRFGHPVLFPLTLTHPKDQNKKITLIGALCEVSKQKRIDHCSIKKTGSNGQPVSELVKIYVNDDDYQINIKGLLCSDNPNDYPLEDVKTLVQILDAGMFHDKDNIERMPSIKVKSDYLAIFGIYELVIEDYDINQVEGIQNAQPYGIRAISNTAVELIEEI